ncbi:MAG: hypothetical protein KAW39_00930 [Thermoplasmata archaeon]|nr:hypothetical protein [Thermoplasmata archaeon]
MPKRNADREPVRRVQHERDNPRTISTDNLKELVSGKFPLDHPLRLVILREKEHLTPEELLAKLQAWLVLLDYEA